MEYNEVVIRRRNFRIDGFSTLADVGMDGPYVSPIQIISKNFVGPMLVAQDWLDIPTALENQEILRQIGYLPSKPFNKVLDMALGNLGLGRTDIYITQAFHLLTDEVSPTLRSRHVERSVREITLHELNGRTPIALGQQASKALRTCDVEHVPVCHPSSRDYGTYRNRANLIAEAIMQVR